MNGKQLAQAVYAAVDALDANAFGDYLTEDCTFIFGNAPALKGRQAVLDEVSGFFASIGGIGHDIQDLWETGDMVIICLGVTFVRKDGQSVTVPTVNIWKRAGDRISDYQIYSDQTPVFA